MVTKQTPQKSKEQENSLEPLAPDLRESESTTESSTPMSLREKRKAFAEEMGIKNITNEVVGGGIHILIEGMNPNTTHK